MTTISERSRGSGTPAGVAVDDATWTTAVALLRGARTATLVCHVSPDGDALGSMLALGVALRRLDVAVTLTWGDADWRVPPAYRWLPGIEAAVPPAQVPESTDVLVVLDTGSRERLGVLGPLVHAATDVIVVDHHANNSAPLRGVLLVDPAVAATAVVVEELVRRLDVPLDLEIATCLYVGLVTDTGSFSHAVTTPAVHALAGRLLAAGVAPDVVHREVWGTRPFAAVTLIGTALARARLDPDAAGGRGLVWTWTTAREVADAGLDVDDVEAVMETLRSAAEADVAVVCKQTDHGDYRVSTRSRGTVDVGAACSALGGGGHRLAAGFTATTDPAAAVAAFAALLG